MNNREKIHDKIWLLTSAIFNIIEKTAKGYEDFNNTTPYFGNFYNFRRVIRAELERK